MTFRNESRKVAPFLKLDAEPYPVLSEGKLYWIQDAYTTSKRFPYSNPRAADFESGLNYIRNSVKVIVDMYDGTVSLYIMDSRGSRTQCLSAGVSRCVSGPESAFRRS